MGFHYSNKETRKHRGQHVERRVVIKGGRGFKSLRFKEHQKYHTVKKSLRPDEIHRIKRGKFIHGLFSDLR